jgi:ABC-type transport system involved in Fe-S cluster assembly fused permease/ATPase subunit
MAQPVREVVSPPDDPPVDPAAVDRAYRFHRARRRAQLERRRERGRARVRFLLATLVLIAVAITLLLVLWHEVQRVFGL